MALIPTNKEQAIMVDDDDYQELSQHKWHAYKDGGIYYARRSCHEVKGKQTTVLMHRVIMRAKAGEQIDHINGNGLDNRTRNLRFCTQAENQINRGPQKNNTSGYKGVCLSKGKWTARIRVAGKLISLGAYTLPEDAAKAYDRAAFKHFGDFAYLNFPIKAVSA